MASVSKLPTGKWRARYRDSAGKEHARHFDRKIDGQHWLDAQTAALITGTHVAPKDARITVGQWCDTWLQGYGTRRKSTVLQARAHLVHIKAEFGDLQLGAVRPSHVRAWCSAMRERFSESYVYSLHSRLSQLYTDAVHDGIVPRNPCSRRTSPGNGKQRPYVATTGQVWALYEAMPERQRVAVLLAAFVGLRRNEACGLRVSDVDFMRGIVTPTVQYPNAPLKSDTSRTPVPIPQSLALALSAHLAAYRADTILTTDTGRPLPPTPLDDMFRAARETVPGLPAGFRYHDLRHYFASLLIDSGASVKVVQARLRHASATTTLNVYGHLFSDADESTRAAVEAVFTARAGTPADSLRTSRSSA
jgi:integrase